MKAKVLIFSKRDGGEAQTVREELTEWLQSRSLEVLDVTESQEKITSQQTKDVLLGVIIGGDGTFLTLVRRLERKDEFPLMGVNLGTLGFITEVDKEEMFPVLELALKKKISEESRPLLSVEVQRSGKRIESAMVFNDAVITKDARTSMLSMEVDVGGEFLSGLKADGYIVSTPTGSSAYSLSAHGPLLHPLVGGIVLVPICPHSLSARPLVIPPDQEVEIRAKSFVGSAYLVYDGQVSFEIKQGDRILVKSAGTSLRLLRNPRQKWAETLRKKLKL